MGILEGKRLLVTGVLTDQSIAYHVARLAQAEGATVVLTSFGRAMSITQRVASRLSTTPPILELDVTNADHLAALAGGVAEHLDGLDGVLHSIAYAPEAALGGNFLTTEWPDVATALQISTYSFKSLAMAVEPLLRPGAHVIGLDFDASVAWPTYDWMGVAKAALESTCRYLARDLGPRGIRVNLVAAGPIRTTAAKSIPGFDSFEEVWAARAPLGWDLSDPVPAAQACIALFSDWFPMTTGEILHVDGGVHAVGA
jgi:enoyl ACP reductase